MTKAKELGLRLLRFLGFRRNSKYVRDYLNTTNIRISIWMCLVIAAIEVWMIIRQTTKYYIPRTQLPIDHPKHVVPGFAGFWTYTGNFWLLLFISLSILAFAVGRLYFRNQKARFVLNFVIGALALTTSLLVIYSSQIGLFSVWDEMKDYYTNVFTILVYSLGALYSVSVLTYSFLAFFKKIESYWLSQTIIAVFGIICLAFGMMVSFSDYIGKADAQEYKQIICFLTMIVYTSALFAYRPIISFVLFGSVFFGFYQMLMSVHDRPFPEGDRVNYLSFVLMLVVVISAIHAQRYNDATKSEELEFKAKYDPLTGLRNYEYFLTVLDARRIDPAAPFEDHYFLFIDVDDFKSYNDRRNFNQGNIAIRGIGDCLAKTFGEENAAHVYADHFVAFCDKESCLTKMEQFRNEILAFDSEFPISLKFGIFCVQDRNEDVRRCFDRARYAASLTKESHECYFIEYDEQLDQGYRIKRHMVHVLDEAIEKGYIRPYYQPVVWAEDGTLCGVEALCRWIDPDPKYGFISPGVFVPFLEKTRLIHKLDRCIVETVCRDIHDALKNNQPVVPVSINFSRLDFELMDPVALLEELVAKYGVPKHYLHVEITESALSENQGLLGKSIEKLRELGYAVWLDDFGSGYSSFNVLKDFRFDVLKIDMQFLNNFATNKNAGVLIEVIVDMCNRIGMKALTEGVETQQEVDFLKKVGCGRLQGYLFGKAMPLDELRKKIADGTYTLAKKFE